MSYPSDRVEELLARRGVHLHDVVRVVEVGSTAHGISSPDTGDDHDYTVVRIEPWDELIVGANDRQSMMIRTAEEGERSQAGDIDLSVYTLRKFAGLAANGNPSILSAIFSPAVHFGSPMFFEELGRIIQSKRAAAAFLGYMSQQIDRWVGARGQKSVTRPELVEAYGFDTKYAAHVVRLGYQGIEYLETGRFSIPMREGLRDLIVGIRTGAMTEREALALAHSVEVDLKAAVEASALPEKPGDWRAWTVDVYTLFRRSRRSL